MYSLERWIQAALIPALALLAGLSLCCQFLSAVDDTDEQEVWLPGGAGGGNGGGGGLAATGLFGNRPAFGPSGASLLQAVSVGFDSPWTIAADVPDCRALAGLQFSGANEDVQLVLRNGAGGQHSAGQLAVSGPLDEVLSVAVDDRSFVIGDWYVVRTALNEAEAGVFCMDLNAGALASRGLACVVVGDLDAIRASELHKSLGASGVEYKGFVANAGSVDVTRVIRSADEILRSGAFDIGVVQVGYDAQGRPVSLTNLVVSPQFQDSQVVLGIRVFTWRIDS